MLFLDRSQPYRVLLSEETVKGSLGIEVTLITKIEERQLVIKFV